MPTVRTADHPSFTPTPRLALPFGAQLALLVAMAFAVPAQLYLAVAMAEPVGAAFGVGTGAASWTGGAFSFAYAAGFLLFGPLSDRVGRRPVLALGALATAVTTALIALSEDFGSFLALRALQGLAAATFAPAALAHVADRAPAARRPFALSVLTTGLLGAGLAGQAFGQLVAGHAPWRTAFWPAAILYALAAAALWRLPSAARAARPGPWREVYAAMGRLARTPGPKAVFGCAVTVFGSFVAMYAVLNARLRQDFGFDTDGLLLVQAIGALGLAAGPLVGRSAAARGPRPSVVAGFAVASCGLLLLQLPVGAPALIGATVVFVAGISLVVPGLVGLLNELAPQARGAAVALHTCVLFIGASLGQLAAPYAGYRPMLAALAALLALAAVVVARYARPRPGLRGVGSTSYPAHATAGRAAVACTTAPRTTVTHEAVARSAAGRHHPASEAEEP